MPQVPPPFARALEYHRPAYGAGGGAGPGVGTMLLDFLFGSALTSAIGSAVVVYHLLTSKGGGFGFEVVAALMFVPGVVVLNLTMAAAVYVGAVLKRRRLNARVTVRPRWLMFLVGLASPPVGAVLGWFVARLLWTVPTLSIPGAAAAVSLPVALVTWRLARARA